MPSGEHSAKDMIMNPISHNIAIGAALFALPVTAGHTQTTEPFDKVAPNEATLNLSALGEVETSPDMATLSLAVTSVAKSASGALGENAAEMGRVLSLLKTTGVAAKDIQTSTLSVSAQYVYAQNEPARLTGYEATHQINVTVRDLTKLGSDLDAAVASGANQVNGVAFGLSDPLSTENAARLQAVQALQAKAMLYAKATGFKAVRLLTLAESGGSSPPSPMVMARFATNALTAPQTVPSPGEMKVSVEVTGRFQLSH
jgi:hypothetical protein